MENFEVSASRRSLPNSVLQLTKTSLRSAFAAEHCYVSQTGDIVETMAELERRTFRMPARVVVGLLAIVLAPLVALHIFFLWRYPQLRANSALQYRTALRICGWALVISPWAFVRIPVVVESSGIRFAWFSRLKWDDVTGARVRTSLGFRILEVSRKRGFTWRPWLCIYDGLPQFLAKHAPAGNPLRRLIDPTAPDPS